MPQKLHKRIIKEFNGIDYKANDIDRDVSNFKDAINIEGANSTGIMGRLGYRPLITGINIPAIFEYNSVDVYGKSQTELIACNGELFSVRETYFTITSSSSLSLGYDTSSMQSYTPSNDSVDPLNYAPLTLTVDSVKYKLNPISGRLNIGQIWDSLVAAGHTLTYPSSTRTLNWGKIGSSSQTNAQVFTVTGYSSGNLQENDITTMMVKYTPLVTGSILYGFERLIPVYILGISGGTLTVRIADSPENIRTTNYEKQIISTNTANGYYFGVAATSATAITKVDDNRVYFKYLEPIITPMLTAQTEPNLTNVIYDVDNPYQGPTGPTGFSSAFLGYSDPYSATSTYGAKKLSDYNSNIANYQAVNANESLFITSNIIPPHKSIGVIANSQYWPRIANNQIVECGLGKYDGRRAYYAGCPKPTITDATGTTGNLAVGTYTYAIIGKSVDAKGRVIYSDYVMHVSTNPGAGTIGFKKTILLAGASWFNLNFGMGATCITNGAGTSTTTITVRAGHGIMVGDTLYYTNTKMGAGVAGLVFTRSAHTMKSTKVTAVRGTTITVDTAVTYIDNQYFVANQTLLILRTKVGGAFPNVYLVSEIPYFDHIYYTGTPNYNYAIDYTDDAADSWLVVPFDLPDAGWEGARTRGGSAIGLHNGRMIVVRDSNLYYSNPEFGTYSIEQTPLINSINVGGNSGEPVTSVQASGDGNLFIFKRNGIYVLRGDYYSANGYPTIAISPMIEKSLGSANGNAVLPYGAFFLAFGSGTFYGVASESIFKEIGSNLFDKVFEGSDPWKAYLSISKNQPVIKLVLSRIGADTDIVPTETLCFVYDLKHAPSDVQADGEITLASNLFKGAWYKWEWRVGAPTSQIIESGGTEYYVCNDTPFMWSRFGTQPWVDREVFHRFNGIWQREDPASTWRHYDGGCGIKNVVNFTPIFEGDPDKVKGWNTLKLFRFIKPSEVGRATTWNGVVDLFYGLSNNVLSNTANVLKLETSLGFASLAETQALTSVSGNFSPALEIKITVDTPGQALHFSTAYLDYHAPFDDEGLNLTSEN